MLANKLLGAAKAAVPQYIEDVFSTWLWSGTDATQVITNNIDLSAKGGLVWMKRRDASGDNGLFDTTRGSFRLISNLPAAQTSNAQISSFNTNGFTLTGGGDYNSVFGGVGQRTVGWTFAKQAKFFDVVTFTAPASGTIVVPHNLGSTPGCVITKATAISQLWIVNHRSLASNQYLRLDDTAAVASGAISYTADASNVTFSAGYLTANATYVMYLFAHNAGGFGAAGTDNVISCGSYTDPTGTSMPTVNLGWEPQFLIIRGVDGGSWWMFDSMRGMPATNNAASALLPNSNGSEITGWTQQINATGFTHPASTYGAGTFIYIAIRRPMKPPTSGTSVFNPYVAAAQGQVTTGFPVDLGMWNYRPGYSENTVVNDRLRGVSSTDSVTNANNFVTSSNAAEAASQGTRNWNNTGFYAVSSQAVFYSFRRAPGFFDIVCDTGTASGHTINHGLAVVPELMIRKKRNSATNSDWVVWHTAFTGTNKYLYLNSTAAEDTNAAFWTSTAPTSTVFSVGTGSRVNNSGDTYVTYLFATVAGVSKVGSYTGNGSSQTINCGFAAGARFILIKRTSSTGSWLVWDTARGIVSGNDPYLALNSTASEVNTDDSIDPDNSGFIVNQVTATNINVNAATYIFLAIA